MAAATPTVLRLSTLDPDDPRGPLAPARTCTRTRIPAPRHPRREPRPVRHPRSSRHLRPARHARSCGHPRSRWHPRSRRHPRSCRHSRSCRYPRPALDPRSSRTPRYTRAAAAPHGHTRPAQGTCPSRPSGLAARSSRHHARRCLGPARRDQAEGARELAHHPQARGVVQVVRPGQGGGHGLDGTVVAELRDLVPEQRRHIGPGRADDQDALPGQGGELRPAEVFHDGRVGQHLRPALGHGLVHGPAGIAVRIDDVPSPLSQEGPPQRYPQRCYRSP